ncbi:MAG: tetratricopeptide repeat protein [Sandaracinaceae bacterium]|nr:tetratricopeptide repeat protein [Sandaracinaceae bacterium]
MVRFGVAALVGWLGVALVAAPPCRADDEPPAGYQAIIREAVREFDAERWAEARAHFERAHALFPNARTLRGIGMCAFEQRDYPAAIDLLERSLRDARRALTAAQRAETEDLLGRARVYVGSFRIVTDPPGAELRVDGEVPARAEDGRVTLAVGEHELLARAPGHHEARRRLRVGGGEDREITLRLRPAGLGDPPLASVALFVAAGATLLVEPFAIGWWVERDDAIAACAAPPAGLRCDNAEVLAEQRDAAIATTVAVAVTALAVAAVALVIWLAGGTDAAPAELACGAAPGGASCRF